MSSFRRRQRIPALDGGLNNKYEPNQIDDIESSDCLNVVFDDRGAVGTREGGTQLNTASVGSFSGDGVYTTTFDDSTQTMTAWWNGSLYTLATTTFSTVPSAQSVFTAGTKVDFGMYQNIAFYGNGTTPYKYNGAEFTRHGIPLPNSTPGGATSSAGVLTGDYYYKVSYVNSYVVEGDVSTFTATISAAASSVIGLTSIPVAPVSFGVASRKIYRSSTPAGTFKLLTTIADNTTTVYADNTDTSSLGANAPTDNGEPIDWSMVLSHKDRLFFVGPEEPSFIYYTELANPFVVKATNFNRIGRGDGERIKAIRSQGDALVIYKTNSVWLIYMADTNEANWVVIKTNSKYGGVSQRGVADFERLQMFLGSQNNVLSGFHALSGVGLFPDQTKLELTAIASDSKSDRIEPDIFSFNRGTSDETAAITYKNKLYFAVPYGSGQLTNNRIYQYDFQRRSEDRKGGSWVPWDGHTVADFTIYNGDLYYQDITANGRVVKLNDGTFNDMGASIDSYWESKELSGGSKNEERTKDWRYGVFTVETLGDWEIGVTYKSDSDKGSGTTLEVNTSPGGSLWGAMIWGVDSWGGGVTREEKKLFFANTTGTRLQLKFDNRDTADRAFKINLVDLYYNLRGLR